MISLQRMVMAHYFGNRLYCNVFCHIAIVMSSLFFMLSSHAADMRLVSEFTTVAVGDEFSVGVVFDADNPANADVVVADAIVQYDTTMLELMAVHVGDAANSDLFYSYSLSSNTFPDYTTFIDAETSMGYTQIRAGRPGTQGIASTQTDVLVARVDFKALDLPPNTEESLTAINLVFDTGEGVNDSKLIVADGQGSNVLSSVQNVAITVGPFSQNIPMSLGSLYVLGLLLAVVVYRHRRSMTTAKTRRAL